MFTINGNEINITRGDSAYIDIEIIQQDGTKYELQEGDRIDFTVKKTVYQKEAIIHKTGKSIKIEPQDTQGMMYAEYKYDVQLTKANGDIETIIEPSPFKVMEEVTF